MACGGCCCGGSHWCCSLLYYVVALACLGYLIYCIVAIPQYRYVAVVLIVLILIFQFGLWRFLPSERSRIREKGRAIAAERLPPTLTGAADEAHEPYV